MAKVPIHFIGLLANVDDSVNGLQLNDGFRIERKSPSEVMSFLDLVEKSYGDQERMRLIAFDSQGSSKGCYCVTNADVDRFEETSRGGAVIKWGTSGAVHSQLQDKLRLLRLFKEGNVVMPYSCLYRELPDGHAQILGFVHSYPIWDRTPFILEPDELEGAQGFITTYSLPLSGNYLQLAFEGSELSYEVHDLGLAFLSLMTAMEVLLHPGDRDELRYRICRNAGALLGWDLGKGETIFREMQGLYDKRSRLVHTGNRSDVTREDVLKLRQYVREAIKEVLSSRMSKGELLTMLNTCGFGQRPWRENAE